MGYMRGGTILRIDLDSGMIVKEPTAEYEKLWFGGRGLNSRILYTETGPAVDPLEPENVLMFSLGPFTGTMVPGSGRWCPAPAGSKWPQNHRSSASKAWAIWAATGDRS
jgi:aldehyde:ferredoxin oxidoreductase